MQNPPFKFYNLQFLSASHLSDCVVFRNSINDGSSSDSRSVSATTLFWERILLLSSVRDQFFHVHFFLISYCRNWPNLKIRFLIRMLGLNSKMNKHLRILWSVTKSNFIPYN